jgi:hypothetical protein
MVDHRLEARCRGIWHFTQFFADPRIGVHTTFVQKLSLIREHGIPPPPAPTIARTDMDPHLPRHAPGRTGQAPQKGGEDPVRQQPLALVSQGIGEVIEGALAAMAPVACAPGAVVVRAPAANVVALAPRTLEQTIFPSECMDVGLALFGVEELVNVREHRHR